MRAIQYRDPCISHIGGFCSFRSISLLYGPDHLRNGEITKMKVLTCQLLLGYVFVFSVDHSTRVNSIGVHLGGGGDNSETLAAERYRPPQMGQTSFAKINHQIRYGTPQRNMKTSQLNGFIGVTFLLHRSHHMILPPGCIPSFPVKDL